MSISTVKKNVNDWNGWATDIAIFNVFINNFMYHIVKIMT